MKVIILAAGRGRRMWPLTKNRPKSLLSLGNGQTVLENQLNTIRQYKIESVIIITGYLSEKIERVVKKYKDINIETIFNPFYDVTDNIASFWIAREKIDGDFILLNGDVIVRPSILGKLIEDSKKKHACMTVCKQDKYEDDDMKVIIRGNKVMEVSKEIDNQKANGVSIGMIAFRKKKVNKIKNVLEDIVRGDNWERFFYLQAIQEMINRGDKVNYFLINQNDWAEIDFHPDLEAAKKKIDFYVPKIKKWKNKK